MPVPVVKRDKLWAERYGDLVWVSVGLTLFSLMGWAFVAGWYVAAVILMVLVGVSARLHQRFLISTRQSRGQKDTSEVAFIPFWFFGGGGG